MVRFFMLLHCNDLNMFITPKKKIAKIISQSIITLAFCICLFAQTNSAKNIWERLQAIENSDALSFDQKLASCESLKKEFEQSGYQFDSVYARIIDRIALFDLRIHNENPTKKTIDFALESVHINTAGNPGSSYAYAVRTYRNLGYYFSRLKQINKSINYCDSALLYSKKLNQIIPETYYARYIKTTLLFKSGDYQSGVEESILGIEDARLAKDTSYLAGFFNMLAQFQLYLDLIQNAGRNADSAYSYAIATNNIEELVFSIKTKAGLARKKRNFSEAKILFEKSINLNEKANSDGKKNNLISNDYTDFGNFCLEDLKDYKSARDCYSKAIEYGKRDNADEEIAKGYINTGLLYFLQKNFAEAEKNYSLALRALGAKKDSTSLQINSAQFELVLGNDLALVTLGNTTELLLTKYHVTHDKRHLDETINNALLADTIISQVRHDQTGEQSKLYWRDRTREFFSNAVEASFEANNAEYALHFMEKSRAVLLNDKLNELGAASYLPKDSLLIEENLSLELIGQQQKLLSLQENTPEYNSQYQHYIKAKTARENFIKSLEKNYPLYYQYKYDDKVPSLKDLQQYLSQNKQNFVHYFISDSVVYILSISAASTKMIRHSLKNYGDTLSAFVRLCANKQMLNSNTGYQYFSEISHDIYQTLFEELNLQPGRVVICPDNFLIPFEALCTDEKGEKFLAYQYAFSYVYSANFLLKKFSNNVGKGNFLGFAPVDFHVSKLPTLTGSDKYLETASKYYAGTKILTGESATKKNFISMVPYYEIVNIFSHAAADSTKPEPQLFMYDSSLQLSELQKITNPATRLVVLSACETGAGKKATGEGIYSLARGFAAAGIPSVAATIWKADDQSIYEITEKFNEHISQNMPVDVALQQAKLDYFSNKPGERSMPYYWANLMLVGNSEPVALSKENYLWWYISGVAVLALCVIFLLNRRHFKKT